MPNRLLNIAFTMAALVCLLTSSAWSSDVEQLAKAAKAGDPAAQYQFGYLNESVDAGIFDYDKAIYWYRRAGEQGNIKAQHRLGYMYRRRVGVDTDYHEAIKWYRMAARQGHKGSMNSLGHMYDHGEDFGEEQNYVEAYKWFSLASRQGNTTAGNNRARIAKWMTPAQIEQAKTQTEAWLRKFGTLDTAKDETKTD